MLQKGFNLSKSPGIRIFEMLNRYSHISWVKLQDGKSIRVYKTIF